GFERQEPAFQRMHRLLDIHEPLVSCIHPPLDGVDSLLQSCNPFLHAYQAVVSRHVYECLSNPVSQVATYEIPKFVSAVEPELRLDDGRKWDPLHFAAENVCRDPALRDGDGGKV